MFLLPQASFFLKKTKQIQQEIQESDIHKCSVVAARRPKDRVASYEALTVLICADNCHALIDNFLLHVHLVSIFCPCFVVYVTLLSVYQLCIPLSSASLLFSLICSISPLFFSFVRFFTPFASLPLIAERRHLVAQPACSSSFLLCWHVMVALLCSLPFPFY